MKKWSDMNHKVIIDEIPPEYDAGYSSWIYDTEKQVDELMSYLTKIRHSQEQKDHSLILYYEGTLYRFKLTDIMKQDRGP